MNVIYMETCKGMAMARKRFIDLSISIEPGLPSDPPMMIPKVIWQAHFAGIDIGYCHMEKMANLAAIGRPYGFTACCFPVKIKGASAGWTRPVAIIEED
jgi:hypothetical protein